MYYVYYLKIKIQIIPTRKAIVSTYTHTEYQVTITEKKYISCQLVYEFLSYKVVTLTLQGLVPKKSSNIYKQTCS